MHVTDWAKTGLRTGLRDWAKNNGLGANSQPNADTDQDGQTEWEEYVFHGDPNKSEPAQQTTGSVTLDGKMSLTYSYRRWADREAAGVT